MKVQGPIRSIESSGMRTSPPEHPSRGKTELDCWTRVDLVSLLREPLSALLLALDALSWSASSDNCYALAEAIVVTWAAARIMVCGQWSRRGTSGVQSAAPQSALLWSYSCCVESLDEGLMPHDMKTNLE